MTLHAIQRAAERYGITLTHDDLRRMVQDITQGRALLCRRAQNGKLPIYATDLGGQAVRVVYDPADARVVSVLPRTVQPQMRHRVDQQARARCSGKPEPRRQRGIYEEDLTEDA